MPDVQLIVMEDLDRQFVNWVETEIRAQGLRPRIYSLVHDSLYPRLFVAKFLKVSSQSVN